MPADNRENALGELIDQARRQLAEISAGASWKVGLFRCHAGGPEWPEPLPGADEPDESARRAAREAARLHSPVVGGAPPLEGPDVERTAGSTFAIPVFDPEVYQPSPLLRPVVGVVTFTSKLTMDQVVTAYELLTTANRYAELLWERAAAVAAA